MTCGQQERVVTLDMGCASADLECQYSNSRALLCGDLFCPSYMRMLLTV